MVSDETLRDNEAKLPTLADGGMSLVGPGFPSPACHQPHRLRPASSARSMTRSMVAVKGWRGGPRALLLERY
jgi:hypothetical protein